MAKRFAVIALMLSLSGLPLVAQPVNNGFTPMGLGGGGGMFGAAISPNNPNLMFLSSDMTGIYRSTDMGRNWTVLPYQQLTDVCPLKPAFTKKEMYWVGKSARSPLAAVHVSYDEGLTWQLLNKKAGPWQTPVTQLAVVDGEAAVLLIGSDDGLWQSCDKGESWTQIATGKCSSLVVIGSSIYSAAKGAGEKDPYELHFSSDGGKNWSQKDIALAAGKEITSLAGGADKSGTCLYATVDKLGLIRSTDEGKSWQTVMPWQHQGLVVMSPNQTGKAYCCQLGRVDSEIWGTTDGGASWNRLFRPKGKDANVELSWAPKDQIWELQITGNGLGVSPTNPDVVMVSSWAEFYVSTDGGASWKQSQNHQVASNPDCYQSNGMEVTAAWRYIIDPNDSQKHFICYTDIGFARSIDGGKSWMSATKGCPWHWSNTYYNIAFDPFVKNRIYAATSYRHDIPDWAHITSNESLSYKGGQGGVVVSDDGGENWRIHNYYLPHLPCTDILIDKNSTPDKMIMYITLYEGGVYKSIDGGKNFEAMNKGLGRPGNMHVIRIRQHPVSGNLYCLITALRVDKEFPVPGGLWKSTDGGENWTEVTAGIDLAWPSEFAVHPADENTMYITASTIPPTKRYKTNAQGGLYKTTDGGKTWKHIVTDADLAKSGGGGFSHCFNLIFHPDDLNLLYFCTETHGLWISRDGGNSFEHFKQFPFRYPYSVSFDPNDRTRMYVGTVGCGVLSGYYLPTAK